jgi:HAD superfamily hydrolase (TIGR01509 family)
MTKARAAQRVVLDAREFDAAIFDMDGVVTQTATVHAAAWKRLFDEYLADRAERGGPPFHPFDIDVDYRLYVDGRPRYDGVEAFLASRGIAVPRGNPDDPLDRETVCGLGNRKDHYFLAHVEREGVRPYTGTVRILQELKAAGLKIGIFSASRNAKAILRAAGVIDVFDECIDGIEAEELGLPGKPKPDVLIELTRRLKSIPGRTAVCEDAIAGVQAGRAGHFRLVIGVNRGGRLGTLTEQGADLEVAGLEALRVAR